MEQTDSATFEWEIENFKNKTSTENSTNEGTRLIKIGNHRFYLVILYVYKGDLLFDQTAIILGNYASTTVDVLYKIALINENGDECFVGECATNFISEKGSYSIKGGLYHLNRDCITNAENRLLPGGKLTIKCELKLLPNVSLNKLSVKEKTLENYKSLLENDKYSDVVFVVGKREFKLHKNILAAQTPVFKAMFDNDLEESKKNRVNISDIQVEVFEELIRFVYTANCELIDQYALDLFVAADMYQLDTLKEICAQSLGANLTIDSVTNIFLLADMHNSAELRSKCIDYISKNCTEVMQTDGWKAMMKNEKNFLLLQELYQGLAVRAKSFFK